MPASIFLYNCRKECILTLWETFLERAGSQVTFCCSFPNTCSLATKRISRSVELTPLGMDLARKGGQEGKERPLSCLYLYRKSLISHTVPFSLPDYGCEPPDELESPDELAPSDELRPSPNLGLMTFCLLGLEKEHLSIFFQGNFLYG